MDEEAIVAGVLGGVAVQIQGRVVLIVDFHSGCNVPLKCSADRSTGDRNVRYAQMQAPDQAARSKKQAKPPILDADHVSAASLT